jgi:hypothetical protein
MPRRKQAVSLTDYRSVISSTGDISVGAYARQQRRRRLAMAAVGLALIGGAAWLLAEFWPVGGGRPTGKHPLVVECIKCHHREVIQVAPGSVPQAVMCPVCHERSCHPVWECRDCGLQFLPTGAEIAAGALRCPRCRSERVGAAETLAGAAGQP